MSMEICEECKKTLTKGEFSYSMNSYLHRPLCIYCQMDVAEREARTDKERDMVRFINKAKREELEHLRKRHGS